MSIQLQNGKTYITSAGFVIEIFSISQNDREYFFATQRTSPGTVNTKLIAEWAKSNYVNWAKHCGWEYNPDGTLKVSGSGDLMRKDLKIISEYLYQLESPEGYKWAGGFPKLVDVTDKGYYLTSTGKVFDANEEKLRYFVVNDEPRIGTKRIRLEKQEVASPLETWPKFYVRSNGSKFADGAVVIRRNEKTSAVLIKFGGDIVSKVFWNGQDYHVNNGDWVEISEKDANIKIYGDTQQAQHYLTDTFSNGIPTFYIYKNNKWFYKCTEGEIEALAREDQIISYIRQGKYKSVTKEEFEKLLTPPMEKKVSSFNPSYPQYYIRTNGELYDGAIVAERTSDQDYRLVGNNGKVILTKQGCWPQVANFVKEKVWIQISKLEADRLITGGTPALKYYVRSNGTKFSDGLVICRDWNDKCVTLGSNNEEGVTPEYNWGTKDSFVYDRSWKEITRSEAIALLNNESLPLAPSVPVKKEEEMSQNKFVSVITTGGSMVAKATNYLYVEPAKIIGGYVKRSLRYIVFTGTIAAVIYGATNPDALKKRVASVLPKITIEAPSVLR